MTCTEREVAGNARALGKVLGIWDKLAWMFGVWSILWMAFYRWLFGVVAWTCGVWEYGFMHHGVWEHVTSGVWDLHLHGLGG